MAGRPARSLENYYVDWIRDRAKHAATGAEALMDEAAASDEAVDTFDVAWARQLLADKSPSAGPYAAAPLVTLGDLFTHPAPPVRLLEDVKRYGRKNVHASESNVPDEIASALYFAGIAAALVRHNQRITTSDDELLRYGFQRLLGQPWIGAPLRELFQSALDTIASTNGIDD